MDNPCLYLLLSNSKMTAVGEKINQKPIGAKISPTIKAGEKKQMMPGINKTQPIKKYLKLAP